MNRVYLVIEYVQDICYESDLEFNESVEAFDSIAEGINTFYTGNTTIISKLDEIETLHHNFTAMVVGEEGIFDIKDHINSLLTDVELDFEDLAEDLITIKNDSDIELNEEIETAQIGVSILIVKD